MASGEVLGVWYEMPCEHWHFEPEDTDPNDVERQRWYEDCSVCEDSK